jgi:putative FmdB family regulatory protein
MPVYEYRCQDCGETFDRTEPMREHDRSSAPRCPKCNSEHVEQTFTPFFAKTGRKT